MAANKLIMVISTFYSSIYAFTRLEQMHATDGVSTREPKHLHGQRDTQVPSRWHTRRPHLSVGALKRPAKKGALACMIALEGPSYRPALQKHQHNAPLFYHTKHTSVEPNGDTLSLYKSCVPHQEESGWILHDERSLGKGIGNENM